MLKKCIPNQIKCKLWYGRPRMVLNCSALCQIPFCIMQKYMYVFISCYHLKKCECKSWYFRFVTLSFPSSTRRLLHTPAKTQTWLLLEIQRLCPVYLYLRWMNIGLTLRNTWNNVWWFVFKVLVIIDMGQSIEGKSGMINWFLQSW